eukprot:284816079_3
MMSERSQTNCHIRKSPRKSDGEPPDFPFEWVRTWDSKALEFVAVPAFPRSIPKIRDRIGVENVSALAGLAAVASVRCTRGVWYRHRLSRSRKKGSYAARRRFLVQCAAAQILLDPRHLPAASGSGGVKMLIVVARGPATLQDRETNVPAICSVNGV